MRQSLLGYNGSDLFSPEMDCQVGGDELESFNSDVCENRVNRDVAGNGGRVLAGGPGMWGLPSSADPTLPANAVIVLARDAGD